MGRGMRVLLVMLTSSTILALPSSQAVAAVTVFSVDSEPGDYIGGGDVNVYRSPVQATGGPTHVEISESSSNSRFRARIDAPTGSLLMPGTYQTSKVPDATRAGLNVSSAARSCAASTGTVTIREVSVVGTTVQAFAASFEHHCEGADPAMFGELRFNSSVAFQAASTYPFNKQDFIPQYDSSNSATSTIELHSHGSEPLQVGAPAILGADADDFKIVKDTCSNQSILPETHCDMELTFTPDATEPTQAVLRIRENTARGERDVILAGIRGGASVPEIPTPEGPLVRTVTKTKLLGNYGRRGKFELFHFGDGVLQVGFTIPRGAADRLRFEVQWNRGGKWRDVASDRFNVKKGLAAAVFAGRVGSYRTKTSFDGKGTFAPSSSDWEYFKITT